MEASGGRRGGWVQRKVKNSDKWVRRWLEVNRHLLYSYQANPAETSSARVMNMFDLRKAREISLVDGGTRGEFVIIPETAGAPHPGYLMRAADSRPDSARDWVDSLEEARIAAGPSASGSAPDRQKAASCCWCCCPGAARRRDESRALLGTS